MNRGGVPLIYLIFKLVRKMLFVIKIVRCGKKVVIGNSDNSPPSYLGKKVLVEAEGEI